MVDRQGNFSDRASLLDAPFVGATIVVTRPREAPLATSSPPPSRLLPTTLIVAAPAGFALVLLVVGGALSARAAFAALIGIYLAVLVLLRPLLKSVAAPWTGAGRPSRRHAAATACGSRTSVLIETMCDKWDLLGRDVNTTKRIAYPIIVY